MINKLKINGRIFKNVSDNDVKIYFQGYEIKSSIFEVRRETEHYYIDSKKMKKQGLTFHDLAKKFNITINNVYLLKRNVSSGSKYFIELYAMDILTKKD